MLRYYAAITLLLYAAFMSWLLKRRHAMRDGGIRRYYGTYATAHALLMARK